ncbi:30S ribosomal protein S20 [Oligoflexaceae bacterium]|nr:30S ribosomal protein S20 [Oligoflexaceae bacterium]
MANHKSSAKRAKQTIVKTSRNRQNLSAVRTAVKKFYAAIEEGKDSEVITGLLKNTQSVVAKAASKGLFHKNKAFRTISRLTKASLNTENTIANAASKKKKKKKKTTSKKSAAKKSEVKKVEAKKKATKKKATTKKKTTKKR